MSRYVDHFTTLQQELDWSLKTAVTSRCKGKGGSEEQYFAAGSFASRRSFFSRILPYTFLKKNHHEADDLWSPS